MSVVVVGKNGYIANKVSVLLKRDHSVKMTTSKMSDSDLHLDLAAPDDFDYKQIMRNDVVLHLAAVSSPDICSSRKEFAYRINVSGAISFMEKCMARGARVLFFSSDTVYGSSEAGEIFDERSKCSPVGEYGEMKHAVERTFMNDERFKSFRLSYVLSRDDKFTSYLKSCSKKNEPAEIFHPLYRNVVYLKDVIGAIAALVKNWEQHRAGVINISGPELLSRKDLALLYREIVDPELKIKIVEPDASFYLARPRVIHTRSLYLEKLLGRKPFTARQGLYSDFTDQPDNGRH